MPGGIGLVVGLEEVINIGEPTENVVYSKELYAHFIFVDIYYCMV